MSETNCHIDCEKQTQYALFHARAIIGRKRGLAGIGTKLVGVKLLNTLH